MQFPHSLAALLAASLALAPWHASAQTEETLEGQLERGSVHSVLWTVSPESGDLIGQVFANASQAGQVILARCLPGLACVAEGAQTDLPDDALVQQLRFADHPSGWWRITQAHSARMQPSLPLQERALRTRFGALYITEEHLLLLKGRPVLGNPQPDSTPMAAAPPTPPTLAQRLAAWWDGLRRKLLTLFGTEEQEAIIPAVARAQALGMHVHGPYPPDTVFMQAHAAAHAPIPFCDVVIAMYHDQGLIPVKYLGVEQGVNVTLGLPLVRTSPDHGTAFDLAGTARADAQSLLAALDMARMLSASDFSPAHGAGS